MDDDLRKLIPRGAGPGLPTRGGGTRWYVPNTEGLDVFRLSPGDSKLDPGNVHSGPHLYVSQTGTCYPLKGNTARWPALPLNEEQFFDHVVLETFDDAVGLWELTAMAVATFPHGQIADHQRLVKGFVRTLLERRWVELFERRPGETDQAGWSVVPRDQQGAVLGALTDAVAWDAKGIATAPVRYFVLGSDIGDAEFHDDLRRRGLYTEERGRMRIRWPFS